MSALSSSSLHRFDSVPYSTSKELVSVTCNLATTVKRKSLSLCYNPSTLRIRCAATKPAKSPGIYLFKDQFGMQIF